jgi:hypothetical protein
MKRLLIPLILAFPVVAQSQDLTLVCNVKEETNYNNRFDVTDVQQETKTYIFKNGRLQPEVHDSIVRRISWSESKISVSDEFNGKDGFETKKLVNIDRISGKVSGFEFLNSPKDKMRWVKQFDGTCAIGKKKF